MEVTVFVVFDPMANAGFDATSAGALLQQKHPYWTILPNGRSGLALGKYDQAPVKLDLSTHASVILESVEMASDLAAKSRVDPTVLNRVGAAGARFEISWNTARDDDPVPETADLIVDAAADLAEAVSGVVLINGDRLLPDHRGAEFDAFRCLFP